MTNNLTTDVLIIGGGIIGMTSALELVKQGFKVIIVDDETKIKSSWAGAGIISPLYPWRYGDFVNELSIKSQALYSKFAQEIKEHSGVDPQYIKHGLLMLDEFDKPNAKKWLQKWQPSYQKQDEGLLFNVASIRNPKLLQGLKKYLQNLGVKFLNTAIKHLNIQNNKVIGAGNIIADNTVICAGSWSANFTDINTYPVKGEIITLKDPVDIIDKIYLKNSNYIVPRNDLILVGATREQVGFDTKLNTHYKKQLFDFATALFPHLKKQPIMHHWCGFRPGSDAIVIQKDDRYDNLFINTGHFTNGVNTAPQSAKIVTNLVMKN